MQLQTIPLDQLRHSSKNVRKTGGKGIDDLAASISAHGLLQNLNVERVDDYYEVIAGGRRLRALQHLRDKQQLGADFPVPCQVVDEATAAETSAAENVIREAMHPADQFEAFRVLAEQKMTDADIAARFGATERHVSQLLKLSRVSPYILDIYRAGDIALEQVQALAISDDHAAQERVWNDSSSWEQRPQQLRQALTKKELSTADSKLAGYVGLAAYEKAGGVARKDLFSEDVYLSDVKLVEKLANEKLAKHKATVGKEGWSWVDVRLDFDWNDRQKFGREYPAGKTFPAEVMAYAGAMVSIGSGGKIEVTRGLVRPGDKPSGKSAAGGRAAPAAKKAKKPGDLSFAQVQRLQGVRTAVLRAELATQPRLALAALAADLAKRKFHCAAFYSDSAIVRIAPDRNFVANSNIREACEKHPATERTDAIEEMWRIRATNAQADVLGWLLKDPEATTIELLAFLAADSIVAGDNLEQKTDAGAAFAAAVGVDLVDHWVTTEEWLSMQPKAYVIAAVTEACGKASAAMLSKLKKDQLAKKAAELIQDCDVGPGWRPKWLPKPLRAPVAKKPRDAKQKAAGDAGE